MSVTEKPQEQVDIFDKAHNFTRAREVQKMGMYPYFIPYEGSEGTAVSYQGREIIMLGANNYLGMTTHPKVQARAIDAVKKFGTGCTGSRFQNGTLTLHIELEEKLADYVGKESALVFATGYQTNLGTISALVGKGDVVVLDKEDHASIVDGWKMSYGELKRFKHNDVDDLDRVLDKIGSEAGKLVVVDGVYSVGGEIAPLPDIVEVCEKHGARLMVDDAHSLGVLGEGHGTAAHFGLTDKADLIMGTFSKSFASVGGFIAGDDDIIHYIQHHGRSMIFSAALPACNVATVLGVLEVLEEEPEYIEKLWVNYNYMKTGLLELGFNIGGTEAPIIPLIIGDDMRTIMFWKGLFDEGLFTNVFVPPGVPPNMSLLRTSYMATHTKEQLDRALTILDEVGHKLGIIS